MLRKLLLILTVVAVSALPVASRAADTIETWDVGEPALEIYVGFDGIGLGRYQKTISSDLYLNYGFTDRFSGYVGASFFSNEYFKDPGGYGAIGIFGTPVDTDHFDFDLGVDLTFGREGFCLIPNLELNFDLVPDGGKWGVYFRLEESITGLNGTATKAVDAIAGEPGSSFQIIPETGLTAGTYWTVKDGHQLLLEYDIGFANKPEAGEKVMEIGGLALGYNVMLTDALEMISQVYFDIPQAGEDFAVGLNVGLIVYFPRSPALPDTSSPALPDTPSPAIPDE
jgi:hypothetical protein